ncbi:hypothetical protein LSH36_216g03005 [Paralvinella palmiformis]|uniref:Reverse transcriptase n=1 Tax=Paralvinella palmiformis TaxID=53620 RepID=A0AAD9N5M3_9ANNE|nr:hypothetical protein LSH36_216g03005 [Paralvinella palmiformis]
MARFDPPPKFSYKADEWEEWLADFDEYRITAKVDKEEGNVQISSLLYSMGAKKAREMYNILKYGKTYKFRVVVTNDDDIETGFCLLSRQIAAEMGLVQLMDKVEVNRDVFGADGLMHTEPITINLRTGAEPYSMSTARRVSFPVMDKVKAELERMKSAGIIKEAIEANDWCVPMVVVVKGSGDVRICVDFKKLNHAVKRHIIAKSRRHNSETCRGRQYFPLQMLLNDTLLPNLEDIRAKFAGDDSIFHSRCC